MKPSNQEKAKAMWLKGDTTVEDIAKRLGVTGRTVHNWKRKGGWEALKESIPDPPKEEPRRPKLVSFEGRDRSAKREPQPFDVGDLNTIAGQTALIDKLIGFAMAEVQDPASPQQYSSAMGAVPKLLGERRAIAPIDKTEFLLKLQDMFRDPAEILEYLKSTGWGRKAS